MNTDLLQVIFNGILVIGVLVALGFITFYLVQYLKALKDRNENEILHLNRAYEDRNKGIPHALELLDLIKTITTQNSILMFRTFRDSHQQYDKIKLSHLADLAGEVAKASARSLSSANTSLRDSILSEEFYNKYMIYSAMVYIKELHSKALEGYDSDEFNNNETRLA